MDGFDGDTCLADGQNQPADPGNGFTSPVGPTPDRSHDRVARSNVAELVPKVGHNNREPTSLWYRRDYRIKTSEGSGNEPRMSARQRGLFVFRRPNRTLLLPAGYG